MSPTKWLKSWQLKHNTFWTGDAIPLGRFQRDINLTRGCITWNIYPWNCIWSIVPPPPWWQLDKDLLHEKLNQIDIEIGKFNPPILEARKSPPTSSKMLGDHFCTKNELLQIQQQLSYLRVHRISRTHLQVILQK